MKTQDFTQGLPRASLAHSHAPPAPLYAPIAHVYGQ